MNERLALARFYEVLDDLVKQIELSGAVDDHDHDMRNLAILRQARELLTDPQIRRLSGQG